MKNFTLHISLFFMLFLGMSILPAKAQQKANTQVIQEETYPEVLPGFYVGARGGYLFKMNSLAKDPAYYLNQGYFTELNSGWRSSKSWLGWQLNFGRLGIERKLPYSGEDGFGLNGYDVLMSQTDHSMWQDLQDDGREFLFDTASVRISEKENLGSWYAMTGPEFWFGNDRLQGFVSLNAGVGMTKFGYYYVEGLSNSSSSLTYNYYDTNGDLVAPVDVTLMDGTFRQGGMTQTTFDSLSFSSTGKLEIEDKYQFHLMTRGTVGAEYFITPRLSANVSASYWYTFVPEWKAHKNGRGVLSFKGEMPNDYKPDPNDSNLDPTGAQIYGSDMYEFDDDIPNKNFGNISANIGLRYWLGRKKEVKPVEKPKEEIVEVPQVRNKNLLVTVKDEPTGLALSGVKVTVYKGEEEYYTGITDENGALPELDNLKEGEYEIKGVLNDIETDIARIGSSDFEKEARTIHKSLLHKDMRFTLVGQTLRAESNEKIGHVKTTLTEEESGDNDFQNSDNDGKFKFQLEPNSDFTVFAEHDGYFSNRENVTTKGLNRSKTLYVDLRLGLSELKEGASFELKNIYYDFDKHNIRPDAARVLDDLYQVLDNHPTMVIELSSHTDSRGSDSYNLALSQRRADAAVNYLVKKGISQSRLVARGYGETRLVNGCSNGVDCSEEEHQANRRTEITIIKE